MDFSGLLKVLDMEGKLFSLGCTKIFLTGWRWAREREFEMGASVMSTIKIKVKKYSCSVWLYHPLE